MSADEDEGRRDRPGRGPIPPVVRATIRMKVDDHSAARGRASVPGAIDPWLRYHQPYAPPPPRSEPLPPPVHPEEHPAPAFEEPPVHPEEHLIPGFDESPPDEVVSPPVTTEPVNEEPARTIDEEPSTPLPAPNQDVAPVRKRSRLLVPLAAAVVAAFVGGTGYLMVTDRDDSGVAGRWTGTPAVSGPAASGSAPADPAPFAVSADGTGADPFGTRAPAYTGAPTRLKVGAIDLDTSLETLRIGGGGELTPPTDFAKAGWYADGTPPGDVGPAVIAGHVDSRRGPAVFYELRRLAKGDVIEVVRGGETVRFTVVSTAWYPKDEFPTEAVYGPTPDRQLRLITCGGVFDRSLRSYTDNLVVYAVAG